MTVLSVLIKSGNYNDFMTMTLVVSGAIASDFEVRIFAMDDAVWALKKDVLGTNMEIKTPYPGYAEAITSSIEEGKVQKWWELMADLKEIGDITITACALVADVAKIHENDFHEIVDQVAGVANFAFDMDDSDFVITF